MVRSSAGGERGRVEEADGDAQVSGLDDWVDVVHFLRYRTQQEKGMCRGRPAD